VRFAPNLGWVDVPLADLLRARMSGDLRVTVGNDADLGALAEHTRGAAVGCDDMVFLAADAGVGGGVIVGGHPLHGVGGYAGELGHLMVNPRGRTCRCGSRGCWETEIGAEAISAALRVDGTEVVVLGGVLRTLYPVVAADVDEALASVALQAPREQVRVLVPALGGDSVLVGAAEKAFEPVLTDPARELGTACRDASAVFTLVGRGHAVPA